MWRFSLKLRGSGCGAGQLAAGKRTCGFRPGHTPSAQQSHKRLVLACINTPARRRCYRASRGAEGLRCRATDTGAKQEVPLEAEVSTLAFQELILFIYQGECDRELQRALNLERLDSVSDIRSRRTDADEALAQIVARKQEQCSMDVSVSYDDADAAAEGVRLRVEMQRAVEMERYDEAAELRERLREVKEQVDAAVGRRSLAQEVVEPRRFRLGQRVTHALHGYRGIVCGWDEVCCEGDAWRAAAGVVGAETQPFYHVLVDVSDWDRVDTLPPVTYVAQDRLAAPPAPRTWLAEHGPAPLQHPLRDALFLGVDERGDLIPTRALRDKFRQERQDIFPPDEDPEGDEPMGPD